jgi:hypothetical protein
MKSAPALAAVALGLVSLSQQTTAAVEAATARSVEGDLINKLDSKTAKPNDPVILKTKSTVRLTDGTEIPKGSKLIGHVVAAKPSRPEDENGEVSLEFDRIELKNGRNIAVRSEMQALSPPAVDTSNDAAAPPANPSSGGRSSGDMYGSSPSPMTNTRIGTEAPLSSANLPAPGTVVGHTGNIVIRTTSLRGVLLARNEIGGGARATASPDILLSSKADVHLDSGTHIVLGVVPFGDNSGTAAER